MNGRIPVPRAVLFDLDGTLSDSLPDIAWALNESRVEGGLPRVSDAVVRSWVGDGAAALVARSVGAADDRDPRIAPTLASFLRHYEAHSHDRSTLYPGVVELLDFLQARDARIACTTNKPDVAARALLGGLGILERFDVLVTPESCGGAKKPDAVFMRTALERLGVSAGDALVVGDGIPDLEAARNAGIRCVAVLSGYGEPAALRAAGADWYVEGLDELARRLV